MSLCLLCGQMPVMQQKAGMACAIMWCARPHMYHHQRIGWAAILAALSGYVHGGGAVCVRQHQG